MEDKKSAIDTPTAREKAVGRPRKHASAADRQKAYRDRLKIKGFRVITRVTRDVRDSTAPLVSDVIDLSRVRGGRGV